GARLNGEYVLQYTNNVSTDIKNKFRAKARTLWKSIQNELETKLSSEIKENKQQLDNVKSIQEQNETYASVKNMYDQKMDDLFVLYENPTITVEDQEQFKSAIETRKNVYKQRKELVNV